MLRPQGATVSVTRYLPSLIGLMKQSLGQMIKENYNIFPKYSREDAIDPELSFLCDARSSGMCPLIKIKWIVMELLYLIYLQSFILKSEKKLIKDTPIESSRIWSGGRIKVTAPYQYETNTLKITCSIS